MIITLIPFLLAARFESTTDSPLWKTRGAEVTYFIQNDAATSHSTDPNCVNMNFHLETMLSCQYLYSSLHCYFHNTIVRSTLADIKQQPRPLPKYVMQDIWTKKILQAENFEIVFGKNGTTIIWKQAEVEPVVRDMITSLARLLIVGVDMSTKQTGTFGTSDISVGQCKIKSFITRSTAPSANEKTSASLMDLFLISRPNESLARPLEIAQRMEDRECPDKYNLYSFFASRELQRINSKDVRVQLDSLENHFIININNFTAFSKVNVSFNNHLDNTKYILDESMSVSLQKISPAECQHCSDENSHSLELG